MTERENSDLRLTEFSSEDGACALTPRIEHDTLEKTWKSLHDFDRMHVGRLESVDQKEAANTNGTVLDGQELWKFGEDFLIPELPAGSNMTLKIRSTWGDPYYVGLNGIEIFNSDGLPVAIEEITADPKDMTVIPKFSDDPRIIKNLIDGVYVTRDDTHLWLAPFRNYCNCVFLKFVRPCQVAMIRIWNYNKSRIHSYRGVRHLEILLDDRVVFKGEVSKAPGASCAQTEELSDVHKCK